MSRLWITYAWSDNDEGDFDYLVKELERAGVQASYDKVALVPGRRLWQQIADRILDAETQGWASLITPASLKSEACQEELAIALDRALRERGEFPLIGLLHQVPAEEAPPALRVRLCVDLADPSWPAQVAAGLSGRPPRRVPVDAGGRIVQLHWPYQGERNQVAIEFRPRFGTIVDWVIMVPKGTDVIAWGVGRPNGGAIPETRLVRSGTGTTPDSREWQDYGSSEPLTAGLSGYLVLRRDALPSDFFVGEQVRGGFQGQMFEIRETAGGLLSLQLAPKVLP